MKILVTGATGQLGHAVCKELAARNILYTGVGSAACDITDKDAVCALFRRERPDAAIHCAAYTAVDRAEGEEALAFAVNETGTRNIAEMCREQGAKMVYISTDYVFPGLGETFYETADKTGPRNIYGRSKLAGELAVKELLKQYFIVRVSWVFGENGSNFVKTMLRLAETRHELGIVADQVGSPTYTEDLAPLLCDMVATEQYGIYHATNEGVCSWAEFAEEIFRLSGKQVKVRHLTSTEYPTKAVRPLNSRMSKASLDTAGFKRMPDWKDALSRYLALVAEGKEKEAL